MMRRALRGCAVLLGAWLVACSAVEVRTGPQGAMPSGNRTSEEAAAPVLPVVELGSVAGGEEVEARVAWPREIAAMSPQVDRLEIYFRDAQGRTARPPVVLTRGQADFRVVSVPSARDVMCRVFGYAGLRLVAACEWRLLDWRRNARVRQQIELFKAFGDSTASVSYARPAITKVLPSRGYPGETEVWLDGKHFGSPSGNGGLEVLPFDGSATVSLGPDAVEWVDELDGTSSIRFRLPYGMPRGQLRLRVSRPGSRPDLYADFPSPGSPGDAWAGGIHILGMLSPELPAFGQNIQDALVQPVADGWVLAYVDRDGTGGDQLRVARLRLEDPDSSGGLVLVEDFPVNPGGIQGQAGGTSRSRHLLAGLHMVGDVATLLLRSDSVVDETVLPGTSLLRLLRVRTGAGSGLDSVTLVDQAKLATTPVAPLLVGRPDGPCLVAWMDTRDTSAGRPHPRLYGMPFGVTGRPLAQVPFPIQAINGPEQLAENWPTLALAGTWVGTHALVAWTQKKSARPSAIVQTVELDANGARLRFPLDVPPLSNSMPVGREVLSTEEIYGQAIDREMDLIQVLGSGSGRQVLVMVGIPVPLAQTRQLAFRPLDAEGRPVDVVGSQRVLTVDGRADASCADADVRFPCGPGWRDRLTGTWNGRDFMTAWAFSQGSVRQIRGARLAPTGQRALEEPETRTREEILDARASGTMSELNWLPRSGDLRRPSLEIADLPVVSARGPVTLLAWRRTEGSRRVLMLRLWR
ncbi:MAG: hypothetical protein VKO21_04255 [Candidatus Sericytochromatia bacterium]|nr:hypothetical protein [Candidatus Sericytochromatia bacterium]